MHSRLASLLILATLLGSLICFAGSDDIKAGSLVTRNQDGRLFTVTHNDGNHLRGMPMVIDEVENDYQKVAGDVDNVADKYLVFENLVEDIGSLEAVKQLIIRDGEVIVKPSLVADLESAVDAQAMEEAEEDQDVADSGCLCCGKKRTLMGLFGLGSL